MLSTYYAEDKLREKAVITANAALHIAPKDPWVLADIAETYDRLGDRQRAIQYAQQSLKTDMLGAADSASHGDRVPAHIFLCVLAYYVEWHLRQAWAPLLFEDEKRREERKSRDPILPAKPSDSAERKKHSHRTVEGLPVYSFGLAIGVGQPGESNLRVEIGETGREVEVDL